MSLFAAILLSSTTVEIDPAWKRVDAPLAQVGAGKIQCIDPDETRRTCAAFIWHSVQPDRRIRVRSVSALANTSAYATESVSYVTYEDGQYCQHVSMADIDALRLVRASAPYTVINDSRLTLQLRQGMVDAIAGKKICEETLRHAETGAWMSVGTIDGEFAGELMSLFSWISASDGYRLKPRA
jgi:hypothetical protein